MAARLTVFCGALIVAFASEKMIAQEITSFADRPDLSPDKVQSGFNFLTAETQQLQTDSFANPGYLWVDKGQRLFTDSKEGKSCQFCHDANSEGSLIGAATRYPLVDSATNALVNLEERINLCRTRHQQLPEFIYESDELLSLTAYVANLSQGMPFDVVVDGDAEPFFNQGREYFFQRKGQLNLACSQCHDDSWGKMLRGDRISQGHSNAFPGYRLEWQTFGSLHRRIRDCDVGVRAEPYQLGADIYKSLELYLSWRAADLHIESPGVRR